MSTGETGGYDVTARFIRQHLDDAEVFDRKRLARVRDDLARIEDPDWIRSIEPSETDWGDPVYDRLVEAARAWAEAREGRGE